MSRRILVETLFPWPALHHGRENIRSWLDFQRHQRKRGLAGPARLAGGLTTAVKEDGEAIMMVWPIDKRGAPRLWNDVADSVWRDSMRELRRHVGHNLQCTVRLNWMPGGGELEHVKTVASLSERKGFWGWARGEREPTEKITRSLNQEFALQLAGIKPRRITAGSPGVLRWP